MNSLTMDFVEQLPTQQGGTGRKAPEREVQLANELKENRGKWAKLSPVDGDGNVVPFTRRNSASNLANGIKQAKRLAWTGGGYEATVRSVGADDDKEFEVYVRYNPDADQSEFDQ